jgi:hypothetical protein
MARQYGLSPYDCAYMVLAEKEKCEFFTFFLLSADAPFIPVHRTGFSGAVLINQLRK